MPGGAPSASSHYLMDEEALMRRILHIVTLIVLSLATTSVRADGTWCALITVLALEG
jgi:hypothetical protein